MKLPIRLLTIAALCLGFTSVVSPAKQAVKAYKTGATGEPWTVAIFNPDNLKNPLSIASFKSTSSVLPGRGLHFNFDAAAATKKNIIKVYPTTTKKAKECIAKNNTDTPCGGVIKSLEVEKAKTLPGSVIKIDVNADYDYAIQIDPPKKGLVSIALKKSCDPQDIETADCDDQWTVEIYDENKASTGVSKKLGFKTEQIRVPVRTPFFVDVTRKPGEKTIRAEINTYGKPLTKKNVMIIGDDGQALVTDAKNTIEKLVESQRANRNLKKQPKGQSQNFGQVRESQKQFGAL